MGLEYNFRNCNKKNKKKKKGGEKAGLEIV